MALTPHHLKMTGPLTDKRKGDLSVPLLPDSVSYTGYKKIKQGIAVALIVFLWDVLYAPSMEGNLCDL